MAIPLIINGQTFQYPEVGDQSWGLAATSWAAAVTSGMLQKAGGTFTLLADVDFGASFGLKSLYYKTRTASGATAGQFRLAHADTIVWRNNAGDGNLALSVDSSNDLLFDGVSLKGIATASNTDSIDLTVASNNLTADLNLSAASATAGYFKATSSIESDGLLVQAQTASGSQTGFLLSTDWTTFNNKQPAGSYITALTGDVTASGPGSAAATIASGVIVNSMISASAAIDFSKLASLTSAHILVGSAGNVATDVAVSGDITITNAGVTAIGANKVANSQLAQMAAHTFKGNNTGSTANALDLTATQLTAELNVMVGDSGSGGTKGLVPAPASGDATKFLSGAGTWTNPTGSGDVVGPGSATADNIASFNGVTGKLIKDSGVAAASVVVGPASATNSALVLFDGTTGKLVKNSSVTLPLPIASGGTGQTSASTAFAALSPLSTKGDLLTYSTVNAALAVGADGTALYADSSQTTGLKWVNKNSSSYSYTDTGIGSPNQCGSTNTKIRRMTNATDVGTAITITNSSTNGVAATINEAGVYSIVYTDRYNSGDGFMGISLNSAQLTTSVQSINIVNRLSIEEISDGGYHSISAVAICAVNDVLRPHTDGNPDNVSSIVKFLVTQIVKF